MKGEEERHEMPPIAVTCSKIASARVDGSSPSTHATVTELSRTGSSTPTFVTHLENFLGRRPPNALAHVAENLDRGNSGSTVWGFR